MPARRPNIPAAIADIGFPAAAGVVGATGLPIWMLAAILIAHGGYWAVTRRRSLANAAPGRRVALAAISLGLIGLFNAIAYALGASIGRMGQ
ncbi:MAG: hypothetical protein NW203_13725 [Hyphomonadaceae bacterium]|nr:hypothetical protein [Hyphomonadaceae bacterium]